MLYAIIFFALLFLDQITKAIAFANVAMGDSIVIIDGVFGISLAWNNGGAWSMFGDTKWAMTAFYVLTIISIIAVTVYFIVKKTDNKWLDISLIIIMSGTVGNFIDRLAFQKVRDFMEVPFLHFTNNVADIAITIGGVMFVVYFLFLDKDAVFKKKPKVEEENVSTENEGE